MNCQRFVIKVFVCFFMLVTSRGQSEAPEDHVTPPPVQPAEEPPVWTYTTIQSPYAQLVGEFWQWRLEQIPEFATSVGVHDYDDRLETFTKEAFAHRKRKCDEFLYRIDIIKPEVLSSREQRNLVLLRKDIQTYVDGYRWSSNGPEPAVDLAKKSKNHFLLQENHLYPLTGPPQRRIQEEDAERLATLNPINFLEGIHKDYTFWMDAMSFVKGQDYRTYIQRLRALATQIYEQMALMKDAIRRGWTSHRVSVEPAVSVLEALDRPAIQTPFFRPFNDSLLESGFNENKVENLRLAGQAVILDQLLPAYRKFRIFLSQEYMEATRPHVGISSLPGGPEYFRDCIHWYLDQDMEPFDLHEMSILEVERIRLRMDQIRRQTGYVGNLNSFMAYTHKAPKFFHVTQEDILTEYQELIAQKIAPRLKWIFKNITMQPMVVQPMPFDGPLGVTMPPSEDGLMPGIFFVNIRRPHKRPKWLMTAVALQEALPGHFYQACYAISQSVPRFMRTREFRKLYSVPFQFPFHSAYTEGWSLYAGSLGRELGLFTNPLDEYGQLYLLLTKFAKIVVDTGMHAFGWSRSQSISYLVSNTGISEEEAEKDVDTYITIPAHTISDAMGYRKIMQLRDRAQLILGKNFNLKDFHHEILKIGPVSLKTLEDAINNWLNYTPPVYSCAHYCQPLFSILASCVILVTLYKNTFR